MFASGNAAADSYDLSSVGGTGTYTLFADSIPSDTLTALADISLLWLAMPLRQAATSSCLQLKQWGMDINEVRQYFLRIKALKLGMITGFISSVTSTTCNKTFIEIRWLKQHSFVLGRMSNLNFSFKGVINANSTTL